MFEMNEIENYSMNWETGKMTHTFINYETGEKDQKWEAFLPVTCISLPVLVCLSYVVDSWPSKRERRQWQTETYSTNSLYAV